jgi:peptide/nickel transport system permease protein
LGLVLPIAALTLWTIALFSRYMRSSTIENLTQDYVRTARSKGLGNAEVLRRHVLRNSSLPIVTLVGLMIPQVVAGALIVEAVFNYPGMGLLFWNAATSEDFPVELGVVLVTGVATIVGSLLADIAYAALDPRVRYR